jgi:hypothetical protein
MFLYEDIRVNGHGSIGVISPTIGKLVNGTQVLGDDVSSSVMSFLANRYPIVDPNAAPPTDQAAAYLAVTAEKFVGFGYKVEGTPTIAQQLKTLAPGRVALANLDDVQAVLGAPGGSPSGVANTDDFRLLIVDSGSVSKYATTGGNYAVLNTGAGAIAATTPSTESKTNPVVLPLVGAGVGFLVGGPVGALVGAGVGLGLNYLQSTKTA